MIKNELLEMQNKLELYSKSSKVNPSIQLDLELANIYIKTALRNMEALK